MFQKGLFGKIIITGEHNRSTTNAEALSLLPAPCSLRSVYEGKAVLCRRHMR